MSHFEEENLFRFRKENTRLIGHEWDLLVLFRNKVFTS
jgi:hypothetical protein